MLYAGIDLGGTKIEIRVLDIHGHQCYIERTPSPRGNYRDTINAIVAIVQKAERSLGQQCHLGIGIPGSIDPFSGQIKNANSTWLIGEKLHNDLAALLAREVAIANDADCMTLSEAVDGAGADAKSVFGVIIGTGVGGGIAFNQQLLNGPNAICGEWGHNPLPWPETEDHFFNCFCGKRGCIETFVSGPSLCEHHNRLTGASFSRVEELVQSAASGDVLAVASMNSFYERLAKGLASIINIIDPEVIVLAGGLSNIQAIYNEVPSRWGRYVTSGTVKTHLRQAKHGDSSGARGAAWLSRSKVS